jgi:PAS domain-containing protein
MVAVAVANEIAMAAVLRLVRGVSMWQVLKELAPDYVPHSVLLSMTVALGLLFATSLAAVPATAVLVLAPLAFLHWGHQAFLAMRADRVRLDGLSRAVAALAMPIDPKDALPTFVDDVREAFSSTTVELVIFDPPTVLRSGEAPAHDALSMDLARILVDRGGLVRAETSGGDPELAAALLAAGRRQSLSVPLVRAAGEPIGLIASFDRHGFQGFEQGEEAVMVALAAAAARAIEKSELLSVLVDERRKLAEIVDRSSDGILTIDLAGRVETWNPAMEAITDFVPATQRASQFGSTTGTRMACRPTFSSRRQQAKTGGWGARRPSVQAATHWSWSPAMSPERARSIA